MTRAERSDQTQLPVCEVLNAVGAVAGQEVAWTAGTRQTWGAPDRYVPDVTKSKRDE